MEDKIVFQGIQGLIWSSTWRYTHKLTCKAKTWTAEQSGSWSYTQVIPEEEKHGSKGV